MNCRYLKFSGRQPLQSRRNIARPNLPSGTVFKFDNVTLVVLLNSHAISPGAHVGALNVKAFRVASVPSRSQHAHCVPSPQRGEGQVEGVRTVEFFSEASEPPHPALSPAGRGRSRLSPSSLFY